MEKELIKNAIFEAYNEFKARNELKKFILSELLKAVNDDEPKDWITIKKTHIPVFEGQTKDDAIEQFIEDKKQNKKIDDIPTDNSGYSLKLKKSGRISENMRKAMEKGYYPEEQVIQTLSKATKDGKKLKELFEKHKTYKTNFALKYEYEGAETYWDDERKELVPSYIEYFDTKEDLEQYKKKLEKNPKFKGIMSEKEVFEWHHISGGGKNKLIDINKLKDLGFKIDTSTANKEFKLKDE